jgi:ribokinase
MTQQIAVVGGVNVDFVWVGPALPKPGQTVLGTSFARHFGGKGANQAVAAARMNGRVQLIGRVGDDELAAALGDSLKKGGIGCSWLLSTPGQSCGTAGIFIGEGAQNQIVLAPGANAFLTAKDVSLALQMIRPDWVVAQAEMPLEALMAASEHPAQFIFNPAPSQPFPEEIWPRVWLATPNETEAEDITGVAPTDEESCRACCDWFLARGVRHVIITLGPRGVWLAGEGLVSGFEVAAVDTTAAGDCFTGSLAAFLAGGLPLAQAARFACAASALSVTKPGAQDSMPSWDQVQSFLKERGVV